MKKMVLVTAGFVFCVAVLITQSVSSNPNRQDPNLITESHNSRHATPQQMALHQQREETYKDGLTNLQAENYSAAEQEFRAVLSAEPNGTFYLGLGEALAAQGKTSDALQAYWLLFHPDAHHSWGGSYMARANLEYALLLNQTGQWAEAIQHYEAALPQLPRSEIPIAVQFTPAVSKPLELEAAARVCLGLDANYVCNALGDFDNDRAFAEYAKAQQLEPDWAMTNYYYGYGWQRLSPAERAQVNQTVQARAALEKAVRLGQGDVKKAAEKALRGA